MVVDTFPTGAPTSDSLRFHWMLPAGPAAKRPLEMSLIPKLSSGRLERKNVLTSCEIEIPKRPDLMVVGTDEFGPELSAKPDPHAKIVGVLSCGGS